MSDNLKFRERAVGEAAVLAMCGSADMTTADRVRTAIESLLDRGYRKIVLDMGDMDFICSMALGAIIAGHVRSKRSNGSIRLANPQPAIRQLLDTTCLTKLLPVFETVEQAATAD